MEKQFTKSKWRIRFGFRSLLLLPVLVAIYFALDVPTKTMGVRDVGARLTRENNGNRIEPAYRAPLVLELSKFHIQRLPGQPDQLVTKSSFYFWFFGLVAKLPFTNETSRELPTASPTFGGIDAVDVRFD